MKIFQRFFYLLLFIFAVFNAESRAGVLDEISHVPSKANFMMYTNIESVFKFASQQNISKYDLPYIMGDLNYEKSEQMLGEFGLTIYNIKEILSVVNTDLVKSKKGTLVLIDTEVSNLKIPEIYRKNVGKDNIFVIEEREKLCMTISGTMIILGNRECITEFIKNKNGGINDISVFKKDFLKQSNGKTYYMSLNVSEYLKKKMDNAIKSGARLGKGLDANIYIKSLLRMQSMQMGLSTENGMKFFAGVQGESPDDGQNLLMVSHFFIVGSSLALTFADMYSKRQNYGNKKNNAEHDKNMEVLQNFFSRIKTTIVDNGVNVLLDFNEKEIAAFSAKIREGIEKEKGKRIARLERKVIDDFILAINKEDTNKINEFLVKKVNLNGKGLFGATILNAAVIKGNTGLVEKLIKSGADVNLRGRRGYSAIQNAVLYDRIDIAKILIKKGASLNVRTWDMSSLLHMAVTKKNFEMVKLLCENGADVNAVNYSGERPIDIAGKKGSKDIVDFFTSKYKQSLKNK